jgi:drug/metabolite transporter (DMT)-like permease
MNKWVMFWLLGLIWGASFLLIAISVEAMSPLQVVFVRTGIAAVGLNSVLLLQGRWLPRKPRVLLAILLLGMVNVAIPFVLITWGEQSVPSGVASVLNGTTALFTLVIAHFLFADERITPQRLLGLLVGFVGVVILASRSATDEGIGELAGVIAILIAAFCYAIGTTSTRSVIRRTGDGMAVSAGSMLAAAVGSGIGMVIAPGIGLQAMSPFDQIPGDALLAVLVLGVVNTFLAYLIFYWLIPRLGAARTAMVTYVVPVVGLLLGWQLGNEPMDARLLLGAALVMASIGVVNFKRFGLFRRTAPATT